MIHVAYGFLPFEINPCTPHLLTSPWVKRKKKHFSDSCKLLSLLIFLKYWYFSTLPFTKVLFGLIVQEWLLFQTMFQRLIVCLHFTAVVFWQMKCNIFRSENKKQVKFLRDVFVVYSPQVTGFSKELVSKLFFCWFAAFSFLLVIFLLSTSCIWVYENEFFSCYCFFFFGNSI